MTVTDDLALLLHTPSGRRLVDQATLARLLGGAQLVDLVLAGRVALAGRRSRFQVVHRVSTGDPVLDLALDRLPGSGTVSAAVGALSPGAVERVMAHLVAAGAVRVARRRVFGLVTVATWPATAPERRAARVARLRAVLRDGTEPSGAEANLVALLDAAGALTAVVGGPRRRVRRRAAEIGGADRVPPPTRRAAVAARTVRLAVVTVAVSQPSG